MKRRDRTTTSPLDLDHETMQRLGRQVADLVANHLAGIRDQPVLASLPRAALQEITDGAAPEAGRSFDELLSFLDEEIFPYHAREPHPRFLAYIPSCPTFPAVLGDWIASGFNFFAGVWPVAAGPNALELLVLEWFRRWIGMPPGAGGLLTSGGSAATVTAVVAARHAAGDENVGRMTMYTSDQAHSSVARAGWIAGIPRRQIRVIATDARLAMRPDDLAKAIEEDRRDGFLPFLIAGTAGSTNTGAVDPLVDIAELATEQRLWFHIDAAYAGFAVLTDRGRALLRGIERADSVTLDPHKWLYVPFECGCLLARDPRRLAAAFRIYPEYLKDLESTGTEINFADYGEQLTRYSRAMKVWLSVSYFGVAAIRAAIERGMELAELLEAELRRRPHVEILSPAAFAILCFRVRPPSADASSIDALNERINTQINQSGAFFISSTRIGGVYSLRVAVVGFRATEDDMCDLADAIDSAYASGARAARVSD